jgi:protein gp37
MGDKTAIGWADATWNAIRMRWQEGQRSGHFCLKISPGCRWCYAGAMQAVRFHGRDYDEVSAEAIRGAKQLVENGFLYLDGTTLLQPTRWRKPRMIFVCSMTDALGEWVPTAWIDQMFAVMALSPHHTFQVLTKRAGRLKAYASDPETPRRIGRLFGLGTILGGAADHVSGPDLATWKRGGVPWPPANVWCGVSVETDAYTWRARDLADTPAAVRFVSAEPLLGPLPSLRFTRAGWAAAAPVAIECVHGYDVCPTCDAGRTLDWLIVGGESAGPLERRLIPSSEQSLGRVRDLRDRATKAGTAFYFKQWGGARPTSGGRLLDGRTWDEWPSSDGTIRESVKLAVAH